MSTVHVHFNKRNSDFIRKIAAENNLSNNDCANRLLELLQSVQVNYTVAVKIPLEPTTPTRVIKKVISQTNFVRDY